MYVHAIQFGCSNNLFCLDLQRAVVVLLLQPTSKDSPNRNITTREHLLERVVLVMMPRMQAVSNCTFLYYWLCVVIEDSNDLVLSFSLSAGIFWRRGRQIIRYENLKDYLTFRVSYLY